MSERDRINGWNEEMLHSYHDGELSGFRRWRLERQLRRSSALRGELLRLESLGDALREHDTTAPAPDLWEAIAQRLPAIDARAAGVVEDAPSWPAWLSPAGWAKPIGALAATAAVAAVFYSGLWQEAPVAGGVVRWIDSGDRGVMVLDDDPEITIIWVLDGAVEGAWIGGRSDEV
ncbi:MAG: hypothetical protein O7B23_05825 [Deltaproteobacteria bacterium]|nr:hypothetical protein [Deltaproteobacteria bacterium]